METPSPQHYSSLVDTSRPFRSVKEAVAIFGERILVGGIYSPKPYFTPPPKEITTPWINILSSPSPTNPKSELQIDYSNQNSDPQYFSTLKKIETELEQTKAELKLLKERGSETEVAVASLNAELHKNMSKLAEAEAAAAAAAAARKVSFRTEEKDEEEKKKREMVIRMESSKSLANILSIGEEKGYFGRNKEKKKKKKMKKKPIVPLVGDFLFFRKKGSAHKTTLDNPLFA